MVVSADLAGKVEETMRVSRAFSDRFSQARIILLMDHPSREMVVDAFRCGASGVFSRNLPLADLLKCIDRVSKGEIWASRSEIDYLLCALRGTPGARIMGCEEIDVLTKREFEVVRQAGEGLSNREIAEVLGLSEHTVKNYLFRACEKIGVSSRVELLFYLLRQQRVSAEKWRWGVGQKEALPDDSLQKAAEAGFAAAQLKLGLAHMEGKDSEQDKRSAYHWLSLTEKNAQWILNESQKALQELRSTMSSSDIKELDRTSSLTSPQQPRSLTLVGERDLPKRSSVG